MKLLLLPPYFYPEKISSSHIGKALREDCARSGINMVLYAPTPTRGLTKSEFNLYKKIKYEEMYDGKLIVHRFYMFREGHNNIQRAFRYLICNMIQTLKSLKEKNLDAIYISSTPPTQGVMAAIIKKIKKIPIIYSLQDIFPDSLVNVGIIKHGSFLWKISRLLEDFTYKNMDTVIVISEDFKKNLLEKGVPENKIQVIYNWVDESSVAPILKEDNILYNEYNLDLDKFYVVYAGNLGMAQNIEVILRSAELLRDNNNIQYLIFGSGTNEKEYRDIASNLKLSNVRFLPMQPYERVSHVYSLGDVSIVSCKEGFGKCAMPSKTWSIMSAGTAVIANFDEGTDLENIIKNNNVGIFTKSGDTEALSSAILKLYRDRDLCQKLGYNGRKFILNNLTREIGTHRYIDAIKELEGKAYVQK